MLLFYIKQLDNVVDCVKLEFIIFDKSSCTFSRRTYESFKITFDYTFIENFIKEQKIILESCHTILIDEAQFFPDLLKSIELVDFYKKTVIIFGLDGDFKREKFGNILDLIPYADSVEKLCARCNNCNNKAIFSHRIIQEKTQIIIGNKDIYIPLCRKCYLQKE
jgi:thymidine kinase